MNQQRRTAFTTTGMKAVQRNEERTRRNSARKKTDMLPIKEILTSGRRVEWLNQNEENKGGGGETHQFEERSLSLSQHIVDERTNSPCDPQPQRKTLSFHRGQPVPRLFKKKNASQPRPRSVQFDRRLHSTRRNSIPLPSPTPSPHPETHRPKERLTISLHPIKHLPQHPPRPPLLLPARLPHVRFPQLVVDGETRLEVIVEGIGRVGETGEGGG